MNDLIDKKPGANENVFSLEEVRPGAKSPGAKGVCGSTACGAHSGCGSGSCGESSELGRGLDGLCGEARD